MDGLTTWTATAKTRGAGDKFRKFVSFTWWSPTARLIVLCSPSARSAPTYHSLRHDITLLPISRPSIFFFSSLSFEPYERRCRPRIKLCRSWRQDTRVPSPTFPFHLFWTTERTCSYLAARMGTQCCANGPAIGSAPLSDTRARFGTPNSVPMGRARRRAVRISQRAF